MATIKGFFAPEQLNTCGINGPSSGECEECGLYKNCKHPRIGVHGEGKKRILIIGSHPGATVDETGIPMSGESGIFLKERFKTRGIDVDVDCWKIDAVSCYPGKDEKGKTNKAERKHIKCCKQRLFKVIADLKPSHILLLGDEAIASYFMEREKNTQAIRWRGLCIPDVDRTAWVIPTYHPNYILRMEKDEHLKATFERDLTFAVKCFGFKDPPVAMPLNKHVTILKRYEDVIRELENVLRIIPEKLAHDYETTGRKPYRKDHRIATISFCYDYDRAFAFPYHYRNHFTTEQADKIADLWTQILVHPKIKKIAQNSKYEDMWAREMFGEVPDMWWCTMLASHILDQRSEFTGLKFQALIRWGVPDYDSKMEKYLVPPKGAELNRVMDAPLNDLLLYNGIDSLLTFRLQIEQEEEFEPYPGLQAARVFFQESSVTLCDIQENGINMDRAYYAKQEVELAKRIEEMKAALHKMPEAILFEKYKKRPINFGSDDDLRTLFFTALKLEPSKMTPGDKASTDASVLATLDTPIAKEITKISKLEKVLGTYLGQFKREIDEDDRMRPFFDLNIPTTYRGSSSNPNFQNIPVRDEEAKMITRSGIIPSPGNMLMDWDYGAMEVRIIACYTQDPVLMAYIFDESTDMHRDMAIELFKFQDTWQTIPSKLGKKIRFEAKNGATFPWFYGSYYRSIARSLFAKCMSMICYEGITILEHLQAIGVIKNKSRAYEEFEAHIKKAEERFWHKFKAVKKWQEKAWSDYIRLGYIEQMFGFRCSGWLTRNDVVNWPVQGTAFHCLLWSINHINNIMKEERMKSLMIGQIHDCCLSDVYPPERQKILDISNQIATKDIREAHKWLVVPLLIEWEEAKINGSWASKIEIRED